MERFDTMIDKVINIEGDYSNDSSDLGGETKFGITKACAVRNGYKGEMKDLTVEQAKAIYKNEYYVTPKFDEISSDAVAYELLDTGVNCGTQKAVKFLQQSLNILNLSPTIEDVVVDGFIGPETINRVNSYPDQKRLLIMLNAVQCAYYVGITDANIVQRKFINGWLSNRVFLQVKNIL